MRALWLVGMMGAGKTTVGTLISCRSGLPFIDIDERIEADANRTISVIWETDGEETFRDLETGEIARIVAANRDCVVATGGGAVLRDENVSAMRGSGLVVWLIAGAGDLAARLGDGVNRPLLLGRPTDGRLTELLENRESAYEQAAHHNVDTSGKSEDEVAREVMKLWNGF